MLEDYLKSKTANKEVFSLKSLKRKFPKDKKQIDKFVFIGLIEPVNQEFVDSVRAHFY